MAGNLVIVAIPDENDRVWKVTSEKKPHMTLLFLGDADAVSNLDQIMQFVEYAANRSLSRFYLPVDHRGELGADKADVLFFKKRRYDFKAVKDFRDLLLKDSNIRTAYDSATQFEAPPAVGQPGQPWVPHLTLGYPETPAKPVPDNELSTFFDVSFNKIAVWTGDFEGPEWLLKDYWDEMDELGVDMNMPMATAMSSLQHLSEEPWSNFTKADYTVEQWHAACLIHTHDGAPTSKSECKLPVKTPDGALNRNGVHAAAAALAGARGGLKGVSADQKTKAANALKRYYAQLDETPPESLAQSTDLVSEFMSHHGVKGMRWGQRKDESGGGTRKSTPGKNAAVAGVAKDTAKAVGRGARKVGRGAVTIGKDIHFESTSAKQQRTSEVHDTAAKAFAKEDVPRINAKYAGTKGGTLKGRLKSPLDPTTRAYRSESRIAYRDQINKAVAALPGNASGTRRYEIEDHGRTNAQYAWTLRAVDVKKTVQHAEVDNTLPLDEFRVKPVFDEDGFIIDVKLVENAMAQTVDLGAEFMEHYGIKGMRWGVRRASDVGSEVHTDTGVFRRQTKVRTTGGEGHPAHEDAIKVAEATQKLKKSGTAALSNKELRDVANRIQLEEQVNGLMTSRGRKFVRRQVEQQGQQGVQVGVRAGAKKAAPAVFKKARKGAATAATVAALGV